MSIVKSMPRMGNVLISPSSGEVLYSGSQGFNHSMRNGAAAKIWFQVPIVGSKADDCFATYEVETGKFNVSIKIVQLHSVSQAAIDSAINFANKVRTIAILRDELLAIPHGKV